MAQHYDFTSAVHVIVLLLKAFFFVRAIWVGQ